MSVVLDSTCRIDDMSIKFTEYPGITHITWETNVLQIPEQSRRFVIVSMVLMFEVGSVLVGVLYKAGHTFYIF